jgi:hypothetical protein
MQIAARSSVRAAFLAFAEAAIAGPLDAAMSARIAERDEASAPSKANLRPGPPIGDRPPTA